MHGQSGKLLGYTGHIVLDCHYYHPLELVPYAQKLPQILISTGITGARITDRLDAVGLGRICDSVPPIACG